MRLFFRPGRRTILVLLPVILIFAAAFTGTASAAKPTSGSVGSGATNKYAAGSPELANAQASLLTAYNAAAAAVPNRPTITGSNLAGRTLLPGVYNAAAGILISGPTPLTLDGNGNPDAVFIFQAGSSLTVDPTSSVILKNGAHARNVFWQVGSSAWLKNSGFTFTGTILALTQITLTDGITVNGRVLARNADVTFIHNTVNNPGPSSATHPVQLGKATTFGALSATAMTNAGGLSVVNGDIGSSTSIDAGVTTPPSRTVSPTSTSFQSTFLAPNFLPGCDPAFSNMTCDYFSLTATATGQVQVCTSFDQDLMGMNDLDVFVYDSAGNTVATGQSTSNPECTIFDVTAGQTYVIAINPAFLVGVVTATTTIQFFPATGGNANGGGSTTGGMSITGGGKTTDGGQFALPVFQDQTKGKIKFALASANCAFRADENTSWIIIWNYQSHTGWVHVEGQGVNNNNAVSFIADIQDNGEPGSSGSAGGPDVFTITAKDSLGNIVCGGGGPLVDGNTQFHPTGV